MHMKEVETWTTWLNRISKHTLVDGIACMCQDHCAEGQQHAAK